MKRSMTVIGELFLCSIIVFILYLLIVPWEQDDLVKQTDARKTVQPNTEGVASRADGSSEPPESVAALFGWKKREKPPEEVREKTAEAAENKVEQKPEQINWLTPIGFALDSGSVRYHFFKDDRTKRVMKLAVGVPVDGWKIVEVSGNEYILDFNGKLYSVKGNP
jgi:hypothetical protein